MLAVIAALAGVVVGAAVVWVVLLLAAHAEDQREKET